MKIIIYIIAIIYALNNVLNHSFSLKVRLNLRNSIREKEITRVDGVDLNFKDIVPRIQLLLAVNEGIYDPIALLENKDNKNVDELRNILLKIIDSKPLDKYDSEALVKAEKKLLGKMNGAINFDRIKVILNIIFLIIIFTFMFLY